MRLAVDIGGTFSDIVIVDDDNGAIHVRKEPSTPDNYANGVVAGVRALLTDSAVAAADICAVIHSTTVGTNTILQRTGAAACLVTTKGFRDVLELGRIRLPVLYRLDWQKPVPLISRQHRLEVDERVDARGNILRALDPDSVADVVAHIRRHSIRSVAICLLNSYVNPIHEQRLAEVFTAALPQCAISLSHQVLPEIQEFERSSTTVADAYIKPSISFYLEELGAGLRRMDINAPIAIMQSNGGMLALDSALAMPVLTVESGPAAGVVAVSSLVDTIGMQNAISFDMGGTTAKASLVEGGKILRSSEYEIGGEISASSRLIKGSGYLIRIPVIDVSEVGNGGGSFVRASRGRMQVGPKSAGALPGPACYGKGNDIPTVTDANVVLGYINPRRLVGGELHIDYDSAWRAIHDHLARPLGLSVEAAAYGVHLLAVSNMTRAVRTVSIERGRDPREYALVAFGGNGPLHAATMAKTLGMSLVLVPPFAGLFSALGLLNAAYEISIVQSRVVPLNERCNLEELAGRARRSAHARYASGGNPPAVCEVSVAADVRYRGQSSHLTLPLQEGRGAMHLIEEFHKEHVRSFGYGSDSDPVELVSIRVSIRGPAAEVKWHSLSPERDGAQSAPQNRRAYFGPENGWLEASVIQRAALDGPRVAGPLIIDEYDSTTVVPPGGSAWLDELRNVRIEIPNDNHA